MPAEPGVVLPPEVAQADARDRGDSLRADLGWLVLTVLLFLPFSDAPFHMDGGYTVEFARRTFQDPLNPYGGSYDHIGSRWLARYWSHPPFLHYYLAPVAGWSQTHLNLAVHLALLPFALLLVPALRLLRPLAPDRRLQALVLTSPLLVVLARAVTWELPVLACSLLCLGLMADGAERRSRARFLLASVPMALALLNSYTAVQLFGPMLVLCVVLRAPLSWSVGVFVLSALPLALFEVGTAMFWGMPHLWLVTATPRASWAWNILQTDWWQRQASLLADLGCLPALVPLLCLAPRMPVATGVAASAGCVVAALLPAPSPWMRVQILLWATAGALALLLVLGETTRVLREVIQGGLRAGGAAGVWASWFWLQALWCLTGASFGTARYVLPMVVPLAYFIARRWRQERLGTGLFVTAMVLNTLLAVVLSTADNEEVNAYERAPKGLASQPAGEGRRFFIGDWAAAAMRRAGYTYLYNDEKLEPGDRIARSTKLSVVEPWIYNESILGRLDLVRTAVEEVPATWPIRLNDPSSGAGFWWSGNGPLPISFTRDPVAEIEVFECRLLPPMLQAAARAIEAGQAEGQGRVTLARFGDGIPRAAIFLDPPTGIAFDLGSGSGALALGMALHPAAPPGDRATLRVSFRPSSSDQSETEMEYEIKGSNWVEGRLEIPGSGRLVILAEAGPAGDPRNDWLCVRPELIGAQAPEIKAAALLRPEPGH